MAAHEYHSNTKDVIIKCVNYLCENLLTELASFKSETSGIAFSIRQ
jgi:hypothetical protein